MIDYDLEADSYDATRGGLPRADAAAGAVAALLPAGRLTVLDVACGTGLVAGRLAARGHTVYGIDRSAGMLAHAAGRLAGRLVRGDGGRLPVADASVDAVTMIWLLHLLDDAEPLLAEAARVLRPGGTLVTTVDKSAGNYSGDSDVMAILRPARAALAASATDAPESLTRLAARHGLRPAGGATFPGLGQAWPPARWIAELDAGGSGWTGGPDVAALRGRLRALPDQDRARAAPVYRLLALRRQP